MRKPNLKYEGKFAVDDKTFEMKCRDTETHGKLATDDIERRKINIKTFKMLCRKYKKLLKIISIFSVL